MAPSERPVFAAHRSNTREWYCPQARIAGYLTSSRLVSPAPALRPSVSLIHIVIHIVQQCGPFATYRWVSCLSASTICRCTTACRPDGGRARLSPSHIAGRILWPAAGGLGIRGLVMTMATAMGEVVVANHLRTLVANHPWL